MRNASEARRRIAWTRFTGECNGATFSAIALLFLSGGSHILASEQHVANIELTFSTVSQFIPALVFLCCAILSYSRRFRKAALAIWFILALFCVVASWSPSHWGDGMQDGTEAMRMHYSRYSFLAEWLLAYASIILLLANVSLIAMHWRRRKR